MEQCIAEEKRLTLTHFTSEDAYRIGVMMVEKAIKEDLPIGIDITAYGKQLFHFNSDLASPDNDNWLRRKRNTVMHFHHSSKYFYLKVNGDQDLIHSKYGLSKEDYATIHGGFPIRLIDAGVIGAICVSGMKPEQDHELITDTLYAYYSIEKEKVNV
jgi:uncharacterized protein (UPF0303 family)